jgi:hypothetical protein
VPSGGASSTSAGQIGNGYNFDGSSGLVTINNNASWAGTTSDMTLEFWFKPNSAAGDYLNILSIGNWGAGTRLFEMANGTVSAQIVQGANPWGTVACGTGALPFLTTPDGKYHHFAMSYTGIYTTYGFFGLYVDGVPACSSPYTTGGAILGDGSQNICLGGACDTLRTNGAMDEFKVSVGTMRSADWILTEVRNQSSPSAFYGVGMPQPSGGPSQLNITTGGTLPAGTPGTAYPATTLAATGGTMPYSWSVVGGALPGGLTLSSGGVISGTRAQSL